MGRPTSQSSVAIITERLELPKPLPADEFFLPDRLSIASLEPTDSPEVVVQHKAARKIRTRAARKAPSLKSSKRTQRQDSLLHHAVRASLPVQTELAEFADHYRRYQMRFLQQTSQPWQQYGNASVITTLAMPTQDVLVVEYEFYEGTQGADTQPWFSELLPVRPHFGAAGTVTKLAPGIPNYRRTTASKQNLAVNIQTLTSTERQIINAALYHPSIIAIVLQWLLQNDICDNRGESRRVRVCIKRIYYHESTHCINIEYGINTQRSAPPMVYQHTQTIQRPIGQFARLCSEAFRHWQTAGVIVTQEAFEIGPITLHQAPLRYGYGLLAKTAPNMTSQQIAAMLPELNTRQNYQDLLAYALCPDGLTPNPFADSDAVTMPANPLVKKTQQAFEDYSEMAAMRWWLRDKYLRPRLDGSKRSTDRFDIKHSHALKLIHALAYAMDESECMYIYKGFLKGKYGFPRLISSHWRFCGIEIGKSELYQQVQRRYDALKKQHAAKRPATCVPFDCLKAHYDTISANDQQLQRELDGLEQRYSQIKTVVKRLERGLEDCMSQLNQHQAQQAAYQQQCQAIERCEQDINQRFNTLASQINTLQRTIKSQQQQYHVSCRKEHSHARQTKDRLKQDIQQQNQLLKMLSPQWQTIDIPNLDPSRDNSFIHQLKVGNTLTMGDAAMDEADSYFRDSIAEYGREQQRIADELDQLCQNNQLLSPQHHAGLITQYQQLNAIITTTEETLLAQLITLQESLAQLESLVADSLPYTKFNQQLAKTHRHYQQQCQDYQHRIREAQALLSRISHALAPPPQLSPSLAQKAKHVGAEITSIQSAHSHCKRTGFALIKIRNEGLRLERHQQSFALYVNERFQDILHHACSQHLDAAVTQEDDGSLALLRILYLSTCNLEQQSTFMTDIAGLIHELKGRYLNQPLSSQSPLKTPAYQFIETILCRRLEQLLQQISGQQQADEFYTDTISALTVCGALSMAVTTEEDYRGYYKQIKRLHKQYSPRKHWYSSEKVELAFPLDDPSEFTEIQRQSITASFRQ
ncbi:MAG: hypothetical protein CMF50_05875 [Legionellales bacterium]|nr:hypothetical protein [Legionellales bacterium]|tara:strand:- start:51866 stop:54979 length:3114 start_codon:yes stop_codon:yes gene_type:complete